jgi:hypothetical protein
VSRYGLDKALWLAIRGEEGDADLTDEERRAFDECDVRSLYEQGAIPFLIYQYALGQAGGFSFEFVGDYVQRLEGVEPVDTVT